MVKNKFIFSITILLMCIGCSSDDTNDQQQNLDNNQAKWESLNITDYSFTQRQICFCVPETVQPTVLLVQDNQTVLSYSAQEEVITAKQFRSSFLKVDELFTRVNALIDNSESLTVEYHPTYGYPTLISVDIDKKMADDEYSIHSESFIDNSNAICPAVFTPSFYLNVTDKDTQESLNCNIFGSYQFEDKELEDLEDLELGQNIHCEIDSPVPVGSNFGIANLTIEASGYQSQELTNIHVIGSHCELKTQNLTIELTAN